MPFQPVRSNTFTDEDLQRLQQLTNGDVVADSVKKQKEQIEKLEAEVRKL